VTSAARPVRLGVRANLAQFTLLVAVSALVGGMLGEERTVLPLLAERVFGLDAVTASVTFIVAFGLVKAATNLAAGVLADAYGRKPVLVAGWLVGVPVPLILIWAPNWGWVIAANVLLGINQGLTWSTTVIAKMDLAGPTRRGLAMGLNEAAGYGGLAVTAYATGWIGSRWGLRPEPFLLGVAYAALGLGLSVVAVRETQDHARLEAAGHRARNGIGAGLPMRRVFALTSYREPALAAATQAGLVNNLNDGVAWGLLPLYFSGHGLSVGDIGLVAAVYPGTWALAQLATGALSDRWGRKPLIVGGMWAQAVALAAIALTEGFGPWLAGAVLLGVGTAMVYPALLAVVGDVAHPRWRGSAFGVYRLWRDTGFAVGALLCGVVADAFGLRAAIGGTALLTATSGAVVALRLYNTRSAGLPPRPTSGGTATQGAAHVPPTAAPDE